MIENVEPAEIRLSAKGRPTCNHWMLRKKRYCKLEAINGKRFCGEHLQPEPDDSTGSNTRVPCPLDGKHTVYLKNLKKHLKICNARVKEPTEPYIVLGYNDPISDPESQAEITTESKQNNIMIPNLSSISDDQFYWLIKQIEYVHLKTMAEIIPETNQDKPHFLVSEQLSVNTCGKQTRKHLLQVSSLLNILEREQFFRDNTNFVELGAGKGQLAVYVVKLLTETKSQGCRVILVDRSNLRYKKENKLPDRTMVQRINADIRNLRLDKLPTMGEGRRCIAFSKHLCGNGTDLALRCVTQPGKQSVDGIVMAFCCHHRCDWKSFVGKKFFAQHKFSELEFNIIIKMVSWAVCGYGHSKSNQSSQSETELLLDNNGQNEHPVTIQRLPHEKRKSIGFMCKDLLNQARAQYLREHGYEVELKQYVPGDVTMENIVLVARKPTEAAKNK